MKWWQALITHIVAVLAGFGAGWLWCRRMWKNGQTNPDIPADPVSTPVIQSIIAKAKQRLHDLFHRRGTGGDGD